MLCSRSQILAVFCCINSSRSKISPSMSPACWVDSLRGWLCLCPKQAGFLPAISPELPGAESGSCPSLSLAWALGLVTEFLSVHHQGHCQGLGTLECHPRTTLAGQTAPGPPLLAGPVVVLGCGSTVPPTRCSQGSPGEDIKYYRMNNGEGMSSDSLGRESGLCRGRSLSWDLQDEGRARAGKGRCLPFLRTA